MGGKIVALTVLSSDEELAKDIAMQVAAMRPLYLDRTQVPAEVLEKEKTILREQAENEGLDASKLDMIVNGRVNKYYEEVCLVDQGFIKENKMKVNKYVESKNSNILSFVRYEVGEGMEKREENFADEELAKDIAMQVAAMRPLYLDRTVVPAEVLEKEKAILKEQAENEGLDPNRLDMIVNGRINKYYEEVCLVDQGFIKENKMKVNKFVESKNSSIIRFVRYEVGEGMEKREENFADEVMKQING
jgi:translation elongation factor EF-Ts